MENYSKSWKKKICVAWKAQIANFSSVAWRKESWCSARLKTPSKLIDYAHPQFIHLSRFSFLIVIMNSCQEWVKHHKVLIGQITCFYLGKTFIGFIELPNDTKNISYTPILMVAAVSYLGAFILKLIKEGRVILRALLPTYLRLFLIWIVSLLSTIFSFSLSHELGWPML